MANILVVDDDPLTRRLLTLMLHRDNHAVVSVENGLDALNYLTHNPIDLVIADICMPVMDGFTLLDKMYQDVQLRDLPVIILTASGRESVAAQAEQSRARGFLTQPFSSWELHNVVVDCLRTEWDHESGRPLEKRSNSIVLASQAPQRIVLSTH